MLPPLITASVMLNAALVRLSITHFVSATGVVDMMNGQLKHKHVPEEI
jgi:hypothetical protein